MTYPPHKIRHNGGAQDPLSGPRYVLAALPVGCPVPDEAWVGDKKREKGVKENIGTDMKQKEDDKKGDKGSWKR